MRLFYSKTSPYARKVLVTALEKEACDGIEPVECDPHVADDRLVAANPMHRIPTLVLDDGCSLYDSPVICEWLDARSEDRRLIPVSGPERWTVLRGQALADGMMDDAVANVMESRRARAHQSPEQMASRADSLLRCARSLESELGRWPASLNLAQIAAACALAYLDFRLPDLAWREGNPALTAWFAEFERRAAMRATRPEG